LLVFIVSLGFFLTPALLGRAPDRMVSNMIELALNEEGNWELASALAFLLLAATALLYVLYIRIVKIEQLYATPEARPRARPARPAFWRTLVERTPFPGTGLAARIGDVPFGVRLAVASAGGGLGLLALARWVYEMPLTLLVVLVVTMAVLTVLAVAVTRRAGMPVSRVALAVFVALVLVYLVLPNVVVIPISFTHHPVFLSFPGTGFTLENFAAYFGLAGAGHFKASGWLWPTLVSFEVAMMVVIVCVPLGSLAAYGLVRGSFVGRDLINYLLISPLIVPAIITAVALFMFLSRNARFMLGSAISLGPLQVPLGFVVAHSLLAMPFVIVILSATLRGIDPGLERAARSLGASRLTTLRRVVLPLMTPGIAASALFAFLTSFDEIVIAIFLSTPDVSTLPKRMWDAIRFEVDPTIAAISTLLVLLTVVVLLAAATVQQLVGRRQLGGTRVP
jgi:putative spermidine/putrescine transport system permease protein